MYTNNNARYCIVQLVFDKIIESYMSMWHFSVQFLQNNRKRTCVCVLKIDTFIDNRRWESINSQLWTSELSMTKKLEDIGKQIGDFCFDK